MKNFIYILILLFSINVDAYVTLGEDASCDYDSDSYTIQQVLDLIGGSNEIRVTNQKEYFENIRFSESFTLKGGFANCTDANFGTVTGKTKINGSSNGSVIGVVGNTNQIYVKLYELTLRNGKGIGSNFGGGISINDSNDEGIDFRIYRSSINNNVGGSGGGIYINGNDLKVNVHLVDTKLVNNDADQYGGGIYCNGSQLNLEGDSHLTWNSAFNIDYNYGQGGGMYVTHDCSVKFLSNFTGELYANSASSHGGGIYIGANSTVSNDGSASANGVLFRSNYSDSNFDLIGDGGAVYLKGSDSHLNLYGGIFKSNSASNGGAIAAFERARVTLDKNLNQCSDCNVFEGNSATKVGAGYGGAVYFNDAIASLRKIKAHGNRASLATVLYASNNSEIEMYSSLIYRNGNGGQDGWNDIYTYKTYDSSLVMINVTSANNASQSAIISQTRGGHVLYNSIFFEPLQSVLAYFVSATPIKDCLLMDDDTGMGITPNSIVGPPLFVDPMNDNYNLTKYSTAIDLCGYSGLIPLRDLENKNRGWDDPQRLNILGTFDAGAFESYAGDVIFKSEF